MGGTLPSSRPQTLPTAARVRKRREFLSIQATGRRFPSRHFLVLQAEVPSPVARLGITVTRKIGNAVERNRVKRAVRETFRRRRSDLRPGIALVVIARDGAARLEGGATASELEPIFARFAPDADRGPSTPTPSATR